jgi:hypothetical protein
MADALKPFRVRHNVSGEMVQMLVAGTLALVVLVVAAAALPGAGKKTSTQPASSIAPTAPYDLAPGSALGAPLPSAAAARGSTAVPGSTGVAAPAAGTALAPGPSSSRFVRASAPGVTPTSVFVGVSYSSQSAAGDRAIGAAGAQPTYDARDVFNAVANYANSHGGFAGRKLKAYFYDYNLTDDQSTQDQSACAFWTQDHKVFSIGATSTILTACAEKAGAIPVGGGATTSQTFAKYPHLIDPDGIAFDRLGRVTVSGLSKVHYFGGKLGLVTWDDPTYRLAIKNGYLPALSAIHVKPTQIAYVLVPQQLQAVGDMTAAVSSAVAKFKSLGIDHVMIQDGAAGVFGGDGLTLEWFDQSRSQQYFPRYGMNPYNNPGAWQLNDSKEMDHGLAVDSADYDVSKDAGWRRNNFREQCFKIEADAGFPVRSSNPNDEAIAGQACDYVFFLQRVLNGLSAISADGFITGAERLGTSLPSATIYGTNLFPGRRDGGDELRPEEYLDSCKCLRYEGPPAYAG